MVQCFFLQFGYVAMWWLGIEQVVHKATCCIDYWQQHHCKMSKCNGFTKIVKLNSPYALQPKTIA
jgi:hypothetical protein